MEKPVGGLVFYSQGTSQSRGVAILVKNNIFVNIFKVEKDDKGRVLAITADIDGRLTNIINIYVLNQDKPSFVRDLSKYIDDSCENMLILGYFNFVLDQDLDRQGTVSNNVNCRNSLLELMSEFELVDVWRMRNPTIKEFTWSNAASNKFSRIDYILVSKVLDAKTENIMFLPGISNRS